MKRFALPLRVSLSTLSIGTLLKIIEFDNDGILISIGFTALCVIYLTRFYLKRKKKFLDIVKVVFVTTYSISGLYKVNHFYLSEYVNWWLGISIVTIFLIYLANYSNGEEMKDDLITNSSLSISVWIFSGLLIGIGYASYITHQGFSLPLLIAGHSLLSIWLIVDLYIPGAKSMNQQKE